MSDSLEPKVSAVVTVYERTAYLAEALESIRKQDGSERIETVVVDDGSSEPVEARFRERFPEVRWVRQRNSGVGAARQAGCDASRGEFVAFLDDDDVWRPEKTRVQLEAFRARPDLDLVASDMTRLADEDAVVTGFYHERRIVEETAIATLRVSPPTFVLSSERLLEFGFRRVPLSPGSMLVRRRRLDEIGGWNPTVRGFGDCADFQIRGTRHGDPGYVDLPLLRIRRGHPEQMTRDGDLALFEEARVLCRLHDEYPADLRREIRGPLAGYLERIAHRLRHAGHPAEAAVLLRELLRRDRPTLKRVAKWLYARVRALR